jgi:pimeloyl-ACP methyl ester carboxylesterase
MRRTALIFLFLAIAPASAQTAPQQHTAEINGFELYYETVGEGEPLLLVHAGLATVRMWDPFVEELAKEHKLIIPDLRGHGRSNNPGGRLSFKQCAGDLLALMESLQLERVRGVGASMGAMTLLHMAVMAPEKMEAMVLVGAGPYIPAECRAQLGKYDADSYPEAGWAHLRMAHPQGDDQIRGLLNFLASLAVDYEDATFTPPHLATIEARTLIVHGDRDYCFPVSLALEMYEAIPDAYLWVVPAGEHVPITGANAGPFRREVVEFLGVE